MARVFIDGFEKNDLRLWDATSGVVAIVAAQTGMSGSYCVDLATGQVGSGYANISKGVPTAAAYYVKFRWYGIHYIYPAQGMCAFYDGSTSHCYLKRNDSSGVLEFWRYGGTATLLATSSAPLSLNTTYLIEMYVLINDSTGRGIVKVNGVPVIDFTGDTRNGANAQITSIWFGYPGHGSWSAKCYMDDIIIDSANWPGDSRIEGIAVTGNGTTNNMTPSAGANYECVNDISDTDYIYTNTNDHIDLFTAGNLTSSIGSIQCVQVQSSSRKQGAATPQNLQLATRIGGSNYVSSNKTLPTNYGVDLSNIWAVNPNTSTAWTEANVNDAEFGIKAVA